MFRSVLLALFCALIVSVSGVATLSGSRLEAPALVKEVSAETSPSITKKDTQSVAKPDDAVKPRLVSITPCKQASAVVKQAQSSTQLPGYHETSTETYYQIHGTDAAELYSQMSTCGPLIDSERFAATTNYSVSWAYAISRENGLCSLSNVSVSLNLLYVYPSWDKQSGTQSTIAKWNSFINNLRVHELEHGQINKSHATNLYSSLMDLKNIECQTILTQAKTLTNNVVNGIKHANQSYDHQTNHGTAQNITL